MPSWEISEELKKTNKGNHMDLGVLRNKQTNKQQKQMKTNPANKSNGRNVGKRKQRTRPIENTQQ